MLRSRSPQQSTTSARRWRTSSCVDHFIFSVGSASPAGITLAKTSGGTYTVVTDPLDDDIASLCMHHASSRRLFRIEAASVIPGFRAVAVMPRILRSSPVTRCRPIAETVVDRKDMHRRVQFDDVANPSENHPVFGPLRRCLHIVPTCCT